MEEEQELVIFLLTTYILGYALQIFSAQIDPADPRSLLLYILITVIPGLIAMGFILYYRDLPILLNFQRWTQSLPYYLFVILLPISCLLIPIIFGMIPSPKWQWLPLVPLLFVLAYLEEMGWRGYIQRRLIDFYSPWIVGLVVGLIWSFYYLPSYFTNYSGVSILYFSNFIIMNIGLSMIMIYILIRTGSFPLVVILHTTHITFANIFLFLDVPGRASGSLYWAGLIYGLLLVLVGTALTYQLDYE